MTNLSEEFFVRVHLRPTFVRFSWLQHTLPRCIETGSRQVPDRGHPRHTILLITGRRNGAAHGFDFQKAKGRPSSRRAIFSRSNSFSTLMFATADFKRRFSSSSTSASRAFKMA